MLSSCKYSEYVESAFPDLLKQFKRKFKDNDKCRKVLLKARGWTQTKGGLLHYTCPDCKGKTAAVRKRIYKRKTKDFISPETETVIRTSYRCLNSRCRREINATTGTLFQGNETNLWLWFLTLFCMALMGGKLPRAYIIKTYYRYLRRCDQFGESVGSEEYKIQAYKNIGERVERVVGQLIYLFWGGNEEELEIYLGYIGFNRKRTSDFVEWYESRDEDLSGFWISWTPSKCDVDNDITSVVAICHDRKCVGDVQYVQKSEPKMKGSWVLCFYFDGKRLANIRWLLVEEIHSLRIHRDRIDYRSLQVVSGKRSESKSDLFGNFQLVQIEDAPKVAYRPFRLTYDFYPAFERAIQNYGVERFKASSNNNVMNCPVEILHETAVIMNSWVDINDNITGSLIDSE